MKKTAAELVAAAIGAGLSRTRIAEIAGCSRMHVWRVQKQKIRNNSRISRLLIGALAEFDQDGQAREKLQAEVMSEIEKIVRKDPSRSKVVLEMLQLAQHISDTT